MHPKSSRALEYLTAVGSIALGLFVSAALAPNDSWFWSNLLFYWVPQACVLSLLCLYEPPRPAAFAGVGLALAAYLAIFGAWQLSRRHPESMAWLGYLTSLPGGVVGSFVALSWLARREKTPGPLAVGSAVAFGVLVGIAANQALVCSTVMYCRGE